MKIMVLFKLTHISQISACCGIFILFSGPFSNAELRQVVIGTNPAGTHAYAAGAGIAKVIQDAHGIRSTVRPFSGSSAYLPLLHRGEITLGLNTSIDSYLAYSGLDPYGAPMTNLRLLARAFPLYIMYMVRADSNLYSVEDLLQKRVVVGVRSNISMGALHRAILATGSLGSGDIDEITVGGLPDGVRLLIEGRADAASIGLDTALTLQAHATVPGGIRYLTMGQDEEKLSVLMPGSKVSPAPNGGVGVGVDEDLRVSEISDYINTGMHLSEEDAYFLVKTIHERWEELRADYPVLSSTPPDGLVPSDNPHPYHDGAIRYYKDVGLWTESHDQNQGQFATD
ncbi:uncharacterized protein METZ01_LOCUS129681 [marine metagenome]|uniref:TAXI family TRAP transporter solute-binding subunit n=1 Tax=marine metagenome TaxID=408172 RepID=A0A381YK51_9ZZZZ